MFIGRALGAHKVGFVADEKEYSITYDIQDGTPEIF
jgi:hypothetical protein